MAVENGAVKYYKNGALLRTSALAPTSPLYLNVAMYTNGSTLTGAVISDGQSSAGSIRWLVTDHLGTPRIILDQTGSLANVKRHDYLPFGEQLFAGTGGRTVAHGYSGDGVRQQFTLKERDNETGLDYFDARYYSSTRGRFTSADLMGGARFDPQSLNRYSYVLNNPMALIDANGYSSDLPCNLGGTGPCIGTFQDPNTSNLSPAKKPGDPFPVASCPGCGSPFGIIADVTTVINKGGGTPISTTDPVLATSPTLRPTFSAGDGLSDTSFVFSAGGFSASAGQYYYLNNSQTMWRGTNGKWNNMTWGGNQWTGGRSLAVAKSGVFKVAGRAFFFGGAAISMSQGYENIQHGNYAGTVKNGLDLGMSAAATFGGPYGLAIGGTYFVGDTIGWKNIMDQQTRLMLETEKVTGKSWHQHIGPIY